MTAARAEAVEVVAHDGAVLRGLRWPGGADVAILVHDAGETDADLEDWNALIPWLLAEAVTVLAFDLRGYGASEGVWESNESSSDLARIVGFARERGARCVVIVAAGTSAATAITTMETDPVDGLVLLSIELDGDEPVPRGAGVPKLLISGVADPGFKAALDRARAASIGWAMAVNLPTDEQGAALCDGSWAPQVRDHLLAFLRERRYLNGGERSGLGAPPESYLERIGLRPEGERP